MDWIGLSSVLRYDNRESAAIYECRLKKISWLTVSKRMEIGMESAVGG